jgi:hypothetical protein
MACGGGAGAARGGEDREGSELFEKAVRPVLVERCFRCHGGEVKAPKGGLSLATPEGILRGGDSGPAVVPGDPEKSLLVRAIRHDDGAPRMPPKGARLTPNEVAAFEAWIRRGAPTPASVAAAAQPASSWAFRPPADPPVPTLGAASPIDAFLEAVLSQRGLQPVPPADRRTLIRRAAYDLTGLPPTPEEVNAFLHDEAPHAFARLVDRLLASPGYGERWARHWLDLARYTDDFDEAWRYRDWVIDALNRDLPYDQFVRAQVAGDLLPGAEAANADGIVATTLLAIGPWGGIDRPKRLTDIVDDQIDIVGRSVLGLTLACARCHDHKFDPISTADYYGLAGVFFSSRVVPEPAYYAHSTPRLRIPLVPPAQVEAHERHAEQVRALERELQRAVTKHYRAFALGLLPRVDRYLAAAYQYQHRPKDKEGVSPEDFAKELGLEGFALHRWVDYLGGPRFGAYRLLDQAARDFDGEPGVHAWRAAAERPWWAANTNADDVVIETFRLPPRSVSVNPGTDGGAVAWRSTIAGQVRVRIGLTDGDPYDGTGVAWVLDQVTALGRHELASGVLPNGGSARLDLATKAMSVAVGDVLELGVALANGDAHYDITNVEYTIQGETGAGEWDLGRDVMGGFLAGNPHGVWSFSDMAGSHRRGRLPAVDRLLTRWDEAVAKAAPEDPCTIEAASRAFAQAVAEDGPEGPLASELTSPSSPFWVKDRDDARFLPADARAGLARLDQELQSLKAQEPSLPCAHGIQEGGLRYSPHPGFADARIHVRGSYERLGPVVPRHVPKALAGDDDPVLQTSGSGRGELAEWLGSPRNPLTARVIVNRIWQHHFGEGLVRTPSNFGRLGEPPTHPELLDWLARRLVETGWSIKAMHRRIMLSAAYQRSSRPTPELLAADPDNRLLGRANRRRLEAEELRDTLFTLGGRLDPRMGGPAEPEATSPRRLIYLAVSRSDRSDFGSLFDRANPALHVERRGSSTAAPQALLLMNQALVLDLAHGLVSRPDILASGTCPDRRIAALYRLLFGRPPTEADMALGRSFVETASGEPDDPKAPAPPWDRYAQGLLLTNEFLYLD